MSINKTGRVWIGLVDGRLAVLLLNSIPGLGDTSHA